MTDSYAISPGSSLAGALKPGHCGPLSTKRFPEEPALRVEAMPCLHGITKAGSGATCRRRMTVGTGSGGGSASVTGVW